MASSLLVHLSPLARHRGLGAIAYQPPAVLAGSSCSNGLMAGGETGLAGLVPDIISKSGVNESFIKLHIFSESIHSIIRIENPKSMSGKSRASSVLFLPRNHLLRKG